MLETMITTVAGVLLLGSIGTQAAETTEQPRQITFSQNAVDLSLPPQPDGTDVTRVFSDWGIELSSESGASPVSGTRTIIPFEGVPTEARVILNGSPGMDAGALAITFHNPVRRLAFDLGSQGGADATVRYFDADGLPLGEDALDILDEYAWYSGGEFDGNGREIGRVEIEYEPSEEPETLFLVRADFVEPPAFRTCVAQVAHGAFPGTNHMLQTQLSTTSSAIPSAYRGIPDAQIQLEVLDPSGEISSIRLNGRVTPLRYETFSLRSDTFRTSLLGSGSERGYTCVTANYPVELAAVYRILDSDDRPISEAGIQGATPGYRFFGPFQKERLEGTNTALAFVNVSTAEATLTVTFYSDALIPRPSVDLLLDPGEQRALFIDELLSDLSDLDAEGTVEIVSDQPIVVTSLRTIQGAVSSSLPLGRSWTPVD